MVHMNTLGRTVWKKTMAKVGLRRKRLESGDPLKMTDKSNFWEGVRLVWKVIPQPMGVFCTHPWAQKRSKPSKINFFEDVWSAPPTPYRCRAALLKGSYSSPLGAGLPF